MATTTTIKAGESAKTITLNEGKALVLTGSAGAAGVAYLLDLVLGGTNSTKSWTVGVGAVAQIGPYSGTQKIQLTCAAGSIDATVQDAVLSTTSSGAAAATITGTPGVGSTLTATLPAGIVGTLQWTRTTKAIPPVKSNIATAVANAVNSLTYQQQVADLNCAIGCDASNQVSPSAPVDVPAGKPTAPTNVVATAGNGTISVTFGAPSSDGGAPITSYTATDSATGDTASGASPLGFTARANDVPRTISVVANNSAGAGTVAVSNSVTPAAGPPATPSITTPTTIGVASSYTPMDSVTSQQWKLDGVNATGGTGATFAQVLADAGKALTLTASNAAGSVTSLPTIPGVRNMKLSNTPNVRAGLAGARCAWVNVGDSDQSGYGSGGTAGSDAGGRQNSYPHKMAAALAAIGLPFGKDSSFGSGLATTPAAYMAYDPRWTFSAGVTLLAGFPSFGGSMFGLPSGETAVWTPGNTFNRVDIMPANSGAATSVEVVVGGTVIQVIPLAAGVSGLKVITVTVPNGTTAVTLRYSVGSGAAVPYIDGITTWTSTAPKIEVLNGALSGTTVQANAVTPVTTVNSTSGYVPRAAMAAIAAAYPNAILCLNGYFNDNPARTITQILADIKLICDHAKLLGWDIAYMGYTTLGAVLSKTQQDSFDDQIIAFLIANYDCWIFQQSKVFPVYSSASAGGYMSDQLHKTATGAQKVADALVGAVKIINSGLLPA